MKDVKHTRLHRRGAVYYFRAAYPADLQRQFAPARERWKSLHTRDHAEALIRVRRESVCFDAEMDKLRRTLAAPLRDDLRADEIEALAQREIASFLQEDENIRIRGIKSDEFEAEHESFAEMAAEARDRLARGDLEGLEPYTQRVLSEAGIRLRPNSEAFRRLTYRLLQALAEMNLKRIARHHGEIVPTPKLTDATTNIVTLSQLITDYLADPSVSRTPKTLMSYRIIFDVLKEIVGPDKPVREITRQDCERVRDTIMKLPKNARKFYPGVPLLDTIALAKRDGRPVLSPGTVNSYLINMASLFNWGVENWRLDRTPAKGLQVHDPVPEKRKRNPIPLRDLPKLFAAPLYTGCKDDNNGYASPGDKHPRRGRFWVPLLSLFHGLRLSEACQLHTTDVRQVEGVWCLVLSEENPDDMDDADRKRLKSDAGQRIVPVHNEILRIGFLAYVSQQAARGERRLFPDLARGHDGTFSPVSKWFSRFLTKIGVKAPRIAFHSLRHSYRDALTRAKLPRDSIRALGGWAGDGAEDNYGGEDAALVPGLAEDVSKVSFPGLDLRFLYRAD